MLTDQPRSRRIRSQLRMIDPPKAAAAASASLSAAAAASLSAAAAAPTADPSATTSSSMLVPPDFPVASLLQWLQSHLATAFFLLLGVGSVAWLIGFNFYLTKAVSGAQHNTQQSESRCSLNPELLSSAQLQASIGGVSAGE